MTNQAALFPFVMATIDNVMSACDKAEQAKAAGTGPGESVLGKPAQTTGEITTGAI